MKNVKNISVLVLLLISVSLFTSCEKGGKVDLSINLSNGTKDVYNLWIGHSSTIDPVNDTQAAGFRTWNVTLDAIGPAEDKMDRIRSDLFLNAAKDGKKVYSKKIHIEMPIPESRMLNATWDGNGFSVNRK